MVQEPLAVLQKPDSFVGFDFMYLWRIVGLQKHE